MVGPSAGPTPESQNRKTNKATKNRTKSNGKGAETSENLKTTLNLKKKHLKGVLAPWQENRTS